MSYSSFLNQFFSGLRDVLEWLKDYLFPSLFNQDNPLFVNYYVFTFMGISLFLFILEEIAGLLTSFRIGGLFFRRFRFFQPRSYDLDYKVSEAPDYTKENTIKPYKPFYKSLYGAKYTGKYFIKYNNRYFPVRVPKYNPFAMRSFNLRYNAGQIVSYDQMMKQNYNHHYSQDFKTSFSKNTAGVSPIVANNITASMVSSIQSNTHFNSKPLIKGVSALEGLADRDDDSNESVISDSEVSDTVNDLVDLFLPYPEDFGSHITGEPEHIDPHLLDVELPDE